MNTKPTRTFRGVWIPAELWVNSNLTAVEKILIMDIHSFTKDGDGEFWKSNETIATDLVCSLSTVKRAVKKLFDMGWVEIETRGKYRFMWSTAKFKMDLMMGQNEPDQVQNEPQPGSKWTTSNTKSNTESKPKSNSDNYDEIIFELFGDSDEVTQAWEVWEADRKERRIKKYTERGLRLAITELFMLSAGNKMTAVEIIAQSIKHGYQGLFPIKSNARNVRPNLDREQAAQWANK